MRKQIPVNSPDISGYLQIKRKMFWVIRYAEIINNSFYYYYNQGDSKPRGVFSLYGSKSIDQQGADNEYVIQFTASKLQQHQRILIRCDKSSDHHNWLNKLIILSQVPPNFNGNINGYSRADNEIQSSQSLMKYKQNQNYDLQQRSETDSLNLDSSSPGKQYASFTPHLQHMYGNQTYDNILQKRSTNNHINEPQTIVQYVSVQADTCKSNPYVFDNNFLTEKNINQNAMLPIKKNLMTALDNFKDCDVLNDIDKNIRLFCSKTAIEARRNQLKGQGSLGSSKNNQNDESNFFMGFINQYFDSPQLKIAMVFVTIIISLIIYQGLSILDAKNLLITIMIILNFILLPLLARKLNEMNYQNQKKKMKQQRQGAIAEFYFPHNVNEILFALTKQFEKRKDWQLTVQKCEPKQGGNINEYVTTYYRGEPETFTQYIIREKDIIYLTEQSTTNGFLRIFSMPVNSQQEDGVNVKYYFYTPYTKIADMKNNPNSPLLLYGINFFLKQQKRNPFSSLFSYYNKNIESASNKTQENTIVQKGQIKEQTSEQSTNLNSASITTTASNKNTDIKINFNDRCNPEQEEQKTNNTNKNEQQSDKQTAQQEEQPKNEESFLLQGQNGEKYNAKIKELINLMQKQVTLDSSNNWKVGENKPDYKTHTKIDEATGNIMSRGEVTVKKGAQAIVDYIQDASQRSNWDEMFKSGNEIEKLSDNCRIEHNVFKGIFPVSDRDFCLLQISLKVENTHYLLATSIQHPQVPEQKKPVRASLKIGGWVITPNSSNESTCVYLTCSDLNGSIPSPIKDSVAKKQSMNALKLKKAIEK